MTDRVAAGRTPSPDSGRHVGAVGALLGIDDPAEAARVAGRLAVVAAHFPRPARLGLGAGLAALDGLARLRTGRSLATLDPDRRDRFVAGLAGSTLVDLLKMPLLLASAPGVSTLDEGGRPDAELDCVASTDWPTCTTADAVVIGSGAGGAMVARTLARAGLSVVVCEEGRRHRVVEFRTRAPVDRFLDLYAGGGATVALGRPPVLLPVGRGVGGTTLVNSGTCYRPPPGVLHAWRARGVDLDPAYLDEVESTIQVAPQPLDVLGRNGLLALAGAEALGWRAAPLRRNAPGCAGSCQCVVGCPRNAKNGVHLNALPQACAAGARIVTHAQVVRILVERGRATGVAVRRPDSSRLEILAPLVVVAAGATRTPGLLHRSGLGRHPQLGRNLAIHPATSVAGRFDTPVVAWRGVLQSVGIEELHDDGILIEATAGPPGLVSFVPPGAGRALRAELAAADRLATLGAMVADRPSGRVHGRLVRYDLAPADAGRLRRAVVAMGRVLFAAGASQVLTGLPRHPTADSVDALTAAAAGAQAADLHLAAFHPTGTARMGADPAAAPVDPDGRLRGVHGVHVADASVLPSCPRVNPQITIMAMALAVADRIVAGLTATANARPPR